MPLIEGRHAHLECSTDWRPGSNGGPRLTVSKQGSGPLPPPSGVERVPNAIFFVTNLKTKQNRKY